VCCGSNNNAAPKVVRAINKRNSSLLATSVGHLTISPRYARNDQQCEMRNARWLMAGARREGSSEFGVLGGSHHGPSATADHQPRAVGVGCVRDSAGWSNRRSVSVSSAMLVLAGLGLGPAGAGRVSGVWCLVSGVWWHCGVSGTRSPRCALRCCARCGMVSLARHRHRASRITHLD